MVVPGRFLDLVDCVHLCRVKLFRDSRVLGYGRLNGHVASIVSMFSKKCVLKRNLYLRGMDDGKFEVVLQQVLQRKLLFISNKFCKEKIFLPQINLYQNLADT